MVLFNLYTDIIIAKNYKRMHDSDYSAMNNFFLSANWNHSVWKLKTQAHKRETSAIGFVSCKIVQKTKILENLDIEHIWWSLYLVK